MKRKEKEYFVSQLREKLNGSQGTFLADYQGLSVASLTKIRRELKATGGEFRIIKNTLLRIASEGTPSYVMKDYMKGPTAVTFATGDLVGTAKVLVNMAKEFEALKLKAGQISGKLIDEGAIKRLSEIPSREVLLSKTLGILQGVPGSFVRVLAGVMGKFLNVLKAIEAQKAQQLN